MLSKFFIIILNLIFCLSIYSNPIAKKGELDLTKIDFSKLQNTVSLNGEWEFYWNSLLSPKDFETGKSPLPKNYSAVPGTWEALEVDGKKLPAKGFATYRLQVDLSDTENISFYTRNFSTSFKLFVNGKEILNSGIVSENENQSQPSSNPISVNYTSNDKHLDIILQISNYDYRMGGPWYPLEIGNAKLIQDKVYYSIIMDMFIFASVFIMGLYHIGLYVNRKKATEALYFGIFCLLISFRALVTGEKAIAILFPSFPWEGMMKLEYWSLMLGLPFFVNYLHSLYNKIIHYKFVVFINIVGGIFSLFVLVTRSYYYTHIVQVYEIIMLITIIYGVVMISIACFQRVKGTLLFLSSLIIFSGTVINDLLYSNQFIDTAYLAPVGFFAFIFLQSYLLSKNFSNAYFVSESLALQLTEKNEALTRLDKLKDDFLANTSHELKTPLNGIIGISESLLDGAGGALPEKVSYNLSLVITSARRLSNLVNDILDFSKMKSHEIKIEKRAVDIYSLANLVCTLSLPSLNSKKIELRNMIPLDLPAADGDENRIEQILYNLIGNAIKFTEKGKIEIEAKIEDNVMEISISDTGIGIPEDKFELIFKSFEQVDSSAERSYSGTGLGLAITKQLVELHGGRIWLSSKDQEGSTFFFTLPVSKDSPVSRQDSLPLPKLQESGLESTPNENIIISNAENKYKILIVDDEPINLQVLQNHLNLENYFVIQANNGPEALELLENPENIPDLALLDVMMPKMTGYEVCQRIREKHSASKLPIIMLTAKNQTNNLVQGFISGANDYLTKPFNKGELFTRIKNHLSLSKTSGAYEKFVPQEIIKLLGKDSIIDVKLGDYSEKFMSVLFSDIRSFTSLSESMSPKDNFNFINSYLKRMSPIIQDHHGFIDKFIGDAIMALFPELTADNAILASISMLTAMKEYNVHRLNSGYNPIEIGIGINSGNLMLGTIGGLNRMEGTVISDSVNVASRMESLTKKYGANLLISELTYNCIEDKSRFNIRPIDRVAVKGKTQLLWIYEVFNSDTEELNTKKLETQENFSQGIDFVHQANWKNAAEIFSELSRISPSDRIIFYYNELCKKNI